MSKRRSKEKIHNDRKEIIKLILKEDQYKDKYLKKHKDKKFYRKYKKIFFEEINESLIKHIEDDNYINFISSFKKFLIANISNVDLFTRYLDNFENIRKYYTKFIASESTYYINKFFKNFGKSIKVEVEEYDNIIEYPIDFIKFIKLNLEQGKHPKKKNEKKKNKTTN